MMKLTTRLRLSHGTAPGQGQEPLEYDVLGLPFGQEAQIYNFIGERNWRVLRTVNGIMGHWEGHYETANEALAALERQV